MVFKWLSKNSTKEKRKAERWSAVPDVRGFVFKGIIDEGKFVTISDASASGCSFIINEPFVKVGDKVQVIFQLEGEILFEKNASIVSQFTYVRQGVGQGQGVSEDALYRYSISFEKPLDTKEMSLLRIGTSK